MLSGLKLDIMVWRSVLVVVVFCALVDSQAPRPAKLSVQSTSRAAASRINYKSVKRSPVAALLLQNETVDATSTTTTPASPGNGKPSSARSR